MIRYYVRAYDTPEDSRDYGPFPTKAEALEFAEQNCADVCVDIVWEED